MRANLRSFTCLEYAPSLSPRGWQQSLLDFASALAHHLQIPAERAALRSSISLSYSPRAPAICVQDRDAGSQALKGIAENESNSRAISRDVAGCSSDFARELRSAPGIGGSDDTNCPNDRPDRLELGKVQEEQTRFRHRNNSNQRCTCSEPRPRFARRSRKTACSRGKARRFSVCPAVAASEQQHYGVGEYGIPHLSQAGEPLLRQDQTGQIYDGGGCHQGRVSPFGETLTFPSPQWAQIKGGV